GLVGVSVVLVHLPDLGPNPLPFAFPKTAGRAQPSQERPAGSACRISLTAPVSCLYQGHDRCSGSRGATSADRIRGTGRPVPRCAVLGGLWSRGDRGRAGRGWYRGPG